jgi:hypothetical protein
VAGGWRKVQNEELHNVHALQKIISMIKSMRMRWAGNVACVEEVRNAKKKKKIGWTG